MTKKTYKKITRLIGGFSLCFIVYLLVCAIIPPLVGTQTKCKESLPLPAPSAARVGLISTNEAALEWRLRLIDSAREEILLSTFDFRADNSGTDVLAALLHAAQRGVQVRLLVDGINAQLHLTNHSSFQALASDENVQIKLYNPIRLSKLWTVNYRCHDKYLIVDRASYIMGGRNTSDLFLGSTGTSRQNADHEVVVRDIGTGEASAATLLRYFNEIWSLNSNRTFCANAAKESIKRASFDLASRWSEISSRVNLSPIDWETETLLANGITILSGDCTAWNKKPLILNTLTELMLQAGENVILQTPYIICNRAMYEVLQGIAAGSARVQIITNAPQNGANPWGCADYICNKDKILAAGVSVCEWLGAASMHTKTILIDNHISLIGSFNWDMRSAYLDTELMLLADCPALNDLLREEATQMLRQGRLVSPDGAVVEGEDYMLPNVSAARDFMQRILGILMQPFRYVL